jgi:hypothetical protein
MLVPSSFSLHADPRPDALHDGTNKQAAGKEISREVVSLRELVDVKVTSIGKAAAVMERRVGRA